jgi:predicted phosphodiesterase
MTPSPPRPEAAPAGRRVAIFTDIHSNLPALTAVLDDIRRCRATQMVCLGDIVGYGAEPMQCVEVVRKLRCVVIRGNHDEAAAHAKAMRGWNDMAREGLKYSRARLTVEEKKWLATLPLLAEVHNATLVHGSLDRPADFNYVADRAEAEAHFRHQERDIAFCGHSHVPGIWTCDGSGKLRHYTGEGRASVKSGGRVLVNAGSVGQPRDGDPRASWVMYLPDENAFEIHRVVYDIGRAQQSILNAALPPLLAARLAAGE